MHKNLLPKYSVPLFLLVILFISLINVGSYGVIETSDARYAEISREMFESEDFLHPTLLGIGHYHKPPFTYYITAISYCLWGVSPFAARFFIQLFIIFQLWLVFKITLELWGDKKLAIWSALIYLSFPIVLISSRNLTTDPYLTTFVILSIYSWILFKKRNHVAYLYLFAASLGLGFLTKGPLIIIVSVVFCVLFSFLNRQQYKNKVSLHSLGAFVVFGIIGGSWFYFLMRENNEYFNYFIGHHIVERYSKDVFQRSEPFWYYLAIAPVVGLPWLLTLPITLWKNRFAILQNKMLRILLLSLVIPFLFFSSASSKLIPYILPLYSLFALLIAYTLKEFQLHKFNKYIIVFFTALITFLNVLAFAFPLEIQIPFICSIIGLLVGVIQVGIWRLTTLNIKSKLISLSTLSALLLLINSGAIMANNELQVNSTQPIANFIVDKQLQNKNILVYNKRLPSLSFNMQKPIISLYDGNRDLNRETQFERDTLWKQNLINLQSQKELTKFMDLLNQESTVLITYKNRIPEERQWILNYYPSKVEMGKWQVYY